MGFLRLGSGGGLLFALCFNLIALATPGWIYTPVSAQGLFQVVSGGVWANVPKGNAEKVAIAFNIMGDVILLCGAIGALIGGAKKEKGSAFGTFGGVLSLLGGVLIMIGLASYTGLYADTVSLSNVSWGYSFVFAWVSFALAIIGGVISIVGN
uniref:epithelial membrane protein 2-like n=1 Tax=Styela clava TaxID=7725 RepID=UPI001939B9C9|nr:epithelial membrane protein 2-like [Styela clava]